MTHTHSLCHIFERSDLGLFYDRASRIVQPDYFGYAELIYAGFDFWFAPK